MKAITKKNEELKIWRTSKMNVYGKVYDEIIKKYAEFLGHETELKCDFTLLRKEQYIFDRLLAFGYALSKVNKSPKTAYLYFWKTGDGYFTCNMPKKLLKQEFDALIFHIEEKESCVCFKINNQNNTYEIISAEDLLTAAKAMI